jgi:hypothetical protein
MLDDTSNNDVDISLEDFEKEFYGISDETPEPETSKPDVAEEAEADDEIAEENEDTVGDVDPASEEDDAEADDEEEDKPQPKQKKKSSFQERLNEVTAARREAERQRDEALRRLEALETRQGSKEEGEKVVTKTTDAPNPDAKDDNGDPVYPAGEFDPLFIRDTVAYLVKQEADAIRAEAEAEKAAIESQRAANELQANWNERLSKAEENLPDLREKIASLEGSFRSIDPDYGQYLAATIMGMEYGPEVLAYLSDNIGEAQKIVASGPTAATLALGRLEASLSRPAPEEKRNKKQVSKAPEPPVDRTRGSNGRFTVPLDTDDLDAFEKEFYKR